MVYTNRDLLHWPAGRPRTDSLYVATEPPKHRGATLSVRIHLDSPAAVLDSHAGSYPKQPTVSSIRAGDGSIWLLSGGVLINDQDGRIAVGLRDGNAADPFAWTNIGAGRCDRALEEHCLEERDTEFILCTKGEEAWHQVVWGPHTPSLWALEKPCVRWAIQEILEVLAPVETPLSPIPLARSTLPTRLRGSILVEWYDPQGCAFTEELPGHLLVDEEAHTTEFRLGLQVDLSEYEGTCLFFGEGTGYGEWMSLVQLRALVAAEGVAGRSLVTPFLRSL
jgi:hypothetical protein